MKLITLDQLHEIWYKFRNKKYSDSKSLADIIFISKPPHEKTYYPSELENIKSKFNYLKQFQNIVDLFDHYGWRII